MKPTAFTPSRSLRRLVISGFTLVEAMVSITVLSIAMIAFLTFMTSSVQISKEEVAESDAQTQSRKLTEEVVNDINGARILYLPTAPALGPNIFSMDTDDATKSYLLLEYQVPPQTTPDGAANWDTGQTFGAFPPGSSATTDGAWYALVFRQIRVLKESDALLNRDIDGDGLLNSTFLIGTIERRFYNPPFLVGTGALAVPYQVDREYPGVVALELDTGSNSPKNTLFAWAETPANIKNDGIFHAYPLPPPNTSNYFPSQSFQNGHWNSILCLSLRFIEGFGSTTRIKLVGLNIKVNHQTVR
jgi:type II secretory pathway pseudopilin PulG